MQEIISSLINGLSISSILLLTALGLSIAFGMMGIINFAHGEFIMIGSYSSYIIGMYVIKNDSWSSLILSFILAFALAAFVGWILERLIIRHLYNRPIDSILATWGISLILQQTAKDVFGANNVEAHIPSILTRGIAITPTISIPYNRLLIFIFCIVVCTSVYFYLYKTAKGRILQAVMQNRAMAACMGVKVRKVYSQTFAFGCGVAGLAGVCISMLGSIGPSTGQNYIIDTFLVVILGGVGGLRGTILGAILIGMLNPFIEYVTSASTAKVIVLTLVFIVLQLKPAGLVPLKDRTID
jgi:urea transport system permease protein